MTHERVDVSHGRRLGQAVGEELGGAGHLLGNFVVTDNGHGVV